MYKKIMVSIDGSETSQQALEAAINLAEEQHATLLVLHVVEESFIYYGSPGFDFASMAALVNEDGLKIMDYAISQLANHPSVKYETKVHQMKTIQNRLAEVILEEAEKWSADLIVLGTHGRRGFSRMFIGSVAENTIRLSTKPVLLIKSPENS